MPHGAVFRVEWGATCLEFFIQPRVGTVGRVDLFGLFRILTQIEKGVRRRRHFFAGKTVGHEPWQGVELFLRVALRGVGRVAPPLDDLDVRGLGRFGLRLAGGTRRWWAGARLGTRPKVAGLSHKGLPRTERRAVAGTESFSNGKRVSSEL